jgi:hypothetical protein
MFRTNAIATVSSGIIPTLVSDILEHPQGSILDDGTFNFFPPLSHFLIATSGASHRNTV